MSKSVRELSLRASLAACVALFVAAGFAKPAAAQDPPADKNKTIVFVCLHGSVKSQMAAAHFNKIAKERGLPYTAVSRGIQIDSSVPTRIRDGLTLDGLAPTDGIPRELTATEANGATKLVAFDAVPDARKGVSEVTYWSDVPPATKDYEAARDAIIRHIDGLVPSLASPTRPEKE